MVEIPEAAVLAKQITATVKGHTVVKEAYPGGSVYYCPTCQPL